MPVATEEMHPCPNCGVPTFEVGPCFKCSALTSSGRAANNKWTVAELIAMTEFAKGFVSGWTSRPGDEYLEDLWVTYADDIDIQFFTNEVKYDDPDRGVIHAHGWRRTPRANDHDCKDEVELI